MDLEDWEYLPDAAYLLRDGGDGGGGGGVRGKRLVRSSSYVYAVNNVFDMDYFSFSTDCPPPAKLVIPIQFRSLTDQAEEVVQRLPRESSPPLEQEREREREATPVATQVFFKSNISKETNEFVDMKVLDASSPRSSPAPAAVIGEFRFDEKADDVITSPRMKRKNKSDDGIEEDGIKASKLKNDVNWLGEGIIGDDYGLDDGGGLNLWKLGLSGIGAICSFGVAAATICLLIFGNNNKPQRSHKLMFQIYADDNMRMNQGFQQATKFNEAMSAAVRGVPLNRAHITYGGYYDNSL